MENPPDTAHWKSLAAAYPNRGDIGNGGGRPALPEPDCASPTSCSNKRATHTSVCPENAMAPDAGADSGPTPDGAAPSDGSMGSEAGDSETGASSGGCSCRASSRGDGSA